MAIRTLHVIPAIAARYGGMSNVVVSMTAALNRDADRDYQYPGRDPLSADTEASLVSIKHDVEG